MLRDLINMLKAHGLTKGLRRFSDEMLENRLFDVRYGVETAGIVTEAEYYELIGDTEDSGAMWYQPTYATPLRKTLAFLKKSLDPKKKPLFIDLGTGKGKPCIIAHYTLGKPDLIGVDLSQKLLDVCESNLEVCGADYSLLCKNVLDIDFAPLFANYDQVVIHNKNSFDQEITEKVLNNILKAKDEKNVYYVYNNPVYKELFNNEECLLARSGWHKNWNINLYSL